MHEPANTRSHATAIGLILGLILATAVFVLMLTELKARNSAGPHNSAIGLGLSPRENSHSSEAEFLRECERFGCVLDQCLAPSTPAQSARNCGVPAVAVLR